MQTKMTDVVTLLYYTIHTLLLYANRILSVDTHGK